MIRHRDSFSARLAGVVVALATVGGMGSAGAAPPEDPLVWPRSSAIATDGVDEALRGAGLRSRDFSPLRARLIGEHEAQAAATRTALSAVERGLASAREAFLDQRYDAMIAALMATETAAAALPAGPLCSASLWEIEFQLGLAYTARGQDGDGARARARFVLVLALDGERRPAAGLYGPDLGLAFLQAVDEVARRPVRPVLTRVSPADAEVVVDCRALGAQAGLRPGLHVVRVDAPGHRPEARIAALSDELELQATLAPTRDAPLGGWWQRGALDPGSASARTAVHAYTGALRVVWLEEAEAQHVARLVVDGVVRRIARAGTAGEAVVQALTADAPLQRADAPHKRRRTGLWVGLAGAALGSIALGLGLGLGLREPSGGHLQLVVP